MSGEGASPIAGRVVAVSATEIDVALDGTGPALGACIAIVRSGDANAARVRAIVIGSSADRVRCAAVDATTGIARGDAASLDADAPDARSLLAIRAPSPIAPTAAKERLDTGALVIDELAPLARGGAAAIVGLEHAPWRTVAHALVDRLASDPAHRIVLVGIEPHVASVAISDGARAPIERCAIGDAASPGAVLLALAASVELARDTMPPRHAIVVVLAADVLSSSLSSLRTRSRPSPIELAIDALLAADASVIVAWSTDVDELDEDALHRRIASSLDTTLVIDRSFVALAAPWPIDPLRSTSRHDPADLDGALAKRSLLARARTIREERLAVLGREQLDPLDRQELLRATNELHRLVGLPLLPDLDVS